MTIEKAIRKSGELFEIAENPIPDGAVSGHLTASDGVRIRYAYWSRRSGRRGTVALFGGRSEFIERYFETVTELLDKGFDVAAMDWRGQGGSDRLLANPQKGHIGDFDEFERDLAGFSRDVLLTDCTPPYFAIAHSMGGAILLRHARRRNSPFRRIVLSAPLIRLDRGRSWGATFAIAQALRAIGLDHVQVPRSSFNRTFPGNTLTSDPLRYDRNLLLAETLPELTIGPPTFGWLGALATVVREFEHDDFPSSVRVPTLLVGAALDRVVDPVAIEELGLEMRLGRRVMIAGARHELLMERDELRDQFWAAFDAFVPGSDLEPGEAFPLSVDPSELV